MAFPKLAPGKLLQLRYVKLKILGSLNFSITGTLTGLCTAQRMKFSIKDFISKYDQIRSSLQLWSNLLKKSLMENFIFCAVLI